MAAPLSGRKLKKSPPARPSNGPSRPAGVAHHTIEEGLHYLLAHQPTLVPVGFKFQELLLRALTRRHAEPGAGRRTLCLADPELDLAKKTLVRAGQRIDLTTCEYSRSEYLLLNRGKVISRVDITEKAWEPDFDTNTNVIDVYISHLRRKLDKDFEPKLIHMVVDIGYVLREG